VRSLFLSLFLHLILPTLRLSIRAAAGQAGLPAPSNPHCDLSADSAHQPNTPPTAAPAPSQVCVLTCYGNRAHCSYCMPRPRPRPCKVKKTPSHVIHSNDDGDHGPITTVPAATSPSPVERPPPPSHPPGHSQSASPLNNRREVHSRLKRACRPPSPLRDDDTLYVPTRRCMKKITLYSDLNVCIRRKRLKRTCPSPQLTFTPLPPTESLLPLPPTPGPPSDDNEYGFFSH
jgi:hypothetical protein